MTGRRDRSNLDISYIRGRLMLGRQVLKLLCSMLVGAILALLAPGETHAQEEQSNCCLLELSLEPGVPGRCYTFFGPNPEVCEVDEGTPISMAECLAGECFPVLAIKLRSFTAETQADGTVTLTWETATEVDNAGFNLYRTKDRGGPYVKINDALIPAEGATVAGASYRFTDRPGSGTFRYMLEDVDYYGVNTLHGPVRVKVTEE